MNPYQTRASIRRQISTRIQKSRYFRVSTVADGNDPNSKILTIVGHKISRIETDSSVLFGDQPGVVSDRNETDNTVTVYFDTPPGAISGILEAWDLPFDIESVNQLINTVVDGAIDLGHRVRDSYTDWWLPTEGIQLGREIQIPAHIDTLSRITASREYNTPRRILLTEDTISPAANGVALATHTIGNDWLMFATDIAYEGLISKINIDTTDQTRDTVLLALSANRDAKVIVSDGVQDRLISLTEDSYRVLEFKRKGGIVPFEVTILSGAEDAQSFTLRIAERIGLLGRYAQTGKLTLDDWRVRRGVRSLDVNMNAPAELFIDGWRLPHSVNSDDDLVEVPADYMVDNCSALLLTSEIQQAALDTQGNNQRASVVLSERASKERYLDRPAYGRYVGYVSRDPVSEDVDVDVALVVVTVDYIADPGQEHVAEETYHLSHAPFEFAVNLPAEAMYLSLEWTETLNVTEIFIDGYDQTEAFIINGNRAVSDKPVLRQDDDSDVVVEIR